MPLADKLKGRNIKFSQVVEPVWKGPQVDGITFSLLCKFLTCRERFRILAILGLKPTPAFNQRIDYGQLWHTCEAALAAKEPWEAALKDHYVCLLSDYPMQQSEIHKWFQICHMQFSIYVKYWEKNPDVKNRTPVFQERAFCIPYSLPSGRTVKLRGKFDSVDIIKRSRREAIYLQENKTKGDLDVEKLTQQLRFDLQSMIYLVALYHLRQTDELPKLPIDGIRYNTIRRPLGGGLHSIRQRTGRKTKQGIVGAETDIEFLKRLRDEVIIPNQHDFFQRFLVEVAPNEVTEFRRQFLDPVLEQLCDWYDWVAADADPWRSGNKGLHWRYPYGVYNPLLEDRHHDLDNFLETGNSVGLTAVTSLFKELE